MRMLHYLNVCEIDGAGVPPVDILTFGSPYQDLSVAGKRAGLKHEANGDDEITRSGLFMEAVRIIKEMRRATNGQQPRYALWENVPGAFSSNKGEDFRVVLEELCRVKDETLSISMPEKGKWATAGTVEGEDWSLAWRTVDAQYHGVPQRRRRILLVADFRGQSAGEILFKCEGLPGYPQPSGTQGQGAPATSQEGAGADDREGTGADSRGGPDGLNPALFENHSQGTRYKGPLDVSPIVSATFGTGGNNQPFVVERKPVYCLQGNGIGRSDDAGCEGKGWREDASYTLNTIDRPAVVYDEDGVVYKETPRYIVRRLTPTECARLQGFPDDWGHFPEKTELTDEEYAFWLEVRNTHATINGRAVKDYTKKQMLTWYNKLHTDSAEYKMWGNGVALPCVRVPIHEMAKRGACTLGSLFDGSGGFPLAGRLEGILPVWASEIEPYPIAVTREQFPEEDTAWML